jgi:hypothetical protein
MGAVPHVFGLSPIAVRDAHRSPIPIPEPIAVGDFHQEIESAFSRLFVSSDVREFVHHYRSRVRFVFVNSGHNQLSWSRFGHITKIREVWLAVPPFRLLGYEHVRRWSLASIRHPSVEEEGHVKLWLQRQLNIVSVDPWTLIENHGFTRRLSTVLGSIGGSLSGTPLPESKPSVDEDKPGGYFSPKKLLVIAGIGISICGFVLVFKVLDKVYLCSGFNVNVAFCGFFVAMFITLVGMYLVFRGFGIAFFHIPNPVHQVSYCEIDSLSHKRAATGLLMLVHVRAGLKGFGDRPIHEAIARNVGFSFENVVVTNVDIKHVQHFPAKDGIAGSSQLQWYGRPSIRAVNPVLARQFVRQFIESPSDCISTARMLNIGSSRAGTETWPRLSRLSGLINVTRFVLPSFEVKTLYAEVLGYVISDGRPDISDCKLNVNIEELPRNNRWLNVLYHKSCGLGRFAVAQLPLSQLNAAIHSHPLPTSEEGVSEQKNKSCNRHYAFGYLPAAKFIVIAFCGILSLSWGWWNIRDASHVGTAIVAYVVGCCLWLYGFGGLMLWLTA